MIHWIYFPRSRRITKLAREVVHAFEKCDGVISSSSFNLNSNGVLGHVRPHLEELGFRVEAGKKRHQKISMPVLFGQEGTFEKSFEADAHHPDEGFIVEVEAGRAVVNNQFLKDIFQACVMADVHYLAIAVRNDYRGADDFQKVVVFLETLYTSGRLQLPLKGILLVGY